MRLQTTSYGAMLGALMLALLLVGAGNAATGRTVVAPPTITDFMPKNGGSGTKVVITGTGLTGAKVQFFDSLATAVAVNSTGTSMTVVVPSITTFNPAPAPIMVTTSGGTAVSGSNFAFGSNPAAPSKTQPAAVKYYTYKTQVKLGTGQTLHFKSGKGYYAA